MLIQRTVLRVAERPPAGGIPLTPVSVGIVQFTGGSDEGKDGNEKRQLQTC